MKKIEMKKIVTTALIAVTSLIVFGVNSLPIVKVQKEPMKMPKELTRDQKEAIVWADLLGGFASAESGPASLLVAAAASIAYYQDKVATEGWGKKFAGGSNPNNNPFTSNNYGEIHNQLCLTYLDLNFPTINYSDIVNVGIKVKPNFQNDFNSLSEQVFNEKVSWAIAQDISTTQKQLNLILSIIPLNQSDINSLTNSLEQIHNSTTVEEHSDKVDILINKIPTFEIQSNHKVNLINSFEILKHSYILWAQ